MNKSFPVFIFLFTSIYSFSQNVTGSWYGRADVDVSGIHNNYLSELVIKQKGNEIEGVFGYYFKNMYQSIFIRGTYDKNTRVVKIKNIPVIHFQANSALRIDCPMDFEGTLLVSKASSTLRGFFLRQEKYKHTCPDIRVTYTLDGNELNQDSVLKNTIAGQKIWSPLPEDVVYTEKTVFNDSNAANVTPVKVEEDSRQEMITKFEARKKIYQQDVTVSSDSVRISFYDNGDVDGDSISVFMNGQPVLAKRELDVRGLNIYLKLDSTKDVNEITMFAENLGRIPPNTALMIVYDGEVRNEIYLSSSLTQNAAVRIRRKK